MKPTEFVSSTLAILELTLEFKSGITRIEFANNPLLRREKLIIESPQFINFVANSTIIIASRKYLRIQWRSGCVTLSSLRLPFDYCFLWESWRCWRIWVWRKWFDKSDGCSKFKWSLLSVFWIGLNTLCNLYAINSLESSQCHSLWIYPNSMATDL